MNSALLTSASHGAFDPRSILLPYQQELLAEKASVVVYEKSRRIGISWAASLEAVLVSSAAEDAGGMDSFYIGFEKEMTRGFIDDAAFWAQHLHGAVSEVDEFLWDDSDKDGDRSIQAFRIRFVSGHTINALTSRPRNLRSKQGFVILDEAAFMDDMEGMLKAAFALLIWGGRVWIISTHDGVDNPFNQLVDDCRALKKPFRLFRTTFEEALEQGLYQRICQKSGKEWSLEGETLWKAEIRQIYAPNDAEELDVIPAQGSGVYLTRALIQACSVKDRPVLRLTCPQGFELKSEAERRSYIDAWLEQTVQAHLDVLPQRQRHYFGQDFALTGDVSCYVPISEERNLDRSVPFVIEMRNVPYDQQKQIVFHVTAALPRFSGGQMDATGNGAILAQETMQKFGDAVIQVKLSQTWYIDNMPHMKAGFEDRTVSIPADTDLIDDLRQVKLIRGVPMVPAGAHTKGSDGLQRHGDFAPALCLGLAATRSEFTTYDGYEGLQGRHAPEPATDEDGQGQPACLLRAFADADETRRGGAW